VRDIVEAMTTNESFFFRDIKPFDQFKAFVLPTILKARAAQKSIRIWSAACSSGQEPYSLAMILTEQRAQLAGWRIEILATDLSTEILDRPRPACTRSSRCSAACRSSCSSSTSSSRATAGRSTRRSARWCSSARSTCSTTWPRSAASMSCSAATC